MLTPSKTVRPEVGFAELRAREFSRLEQSGYAYLDYTGAALYGSSQLRAHRRLLERAVLGNPHSASRASRASTDLLDAARAMVLEFLDASPAEYAVCFTSNASAAIKLVGESYPFDPDSVLLLAADNHNSVNGIREFARAKGARARYLPLDSELRLAGAEEILACEARRHSRGLLAFPAQSNFSGVRHPVSLAGRARQLGFDVLIDIAAFVPTAAFSLRKVHADFVALSFYKLFGYPTGVGALVARRDALARLRRPWFAGGTVSYASVGLDRYISRPGEAGFEDGTPDFLGIAGLAPGFALLAEAGLPRIAEHVARLTRRFLAGLDGCRHRDGRPAIAVYGPRDLHDRGATVAFNVIDERGFPVPFEIVEARARDAGVVLRGGCFCNPGASEAAFGYDVALLSRCIDDTFTVERFQRRAGPSVAVGALRASFGLATSNEDVDRALLLLATFCSWKP